MSSARGQYRRASLEDDDLIDPDDGKHRVQAARQTTAKQQNEKLMR